MFVPVEASARGRSALALRPGNASALSCRRRSSLRRFGAVEEREADRAVRHEASCFPVVAPQEHSRLLESV